MSEIGVRNTKNMKVREKRCVFVRVLKEVSIIMTITQSRIGQDRER